MPGSFESVLHGHLTTPQVNNTRISHVRYLGHERGGKENIIGSHDQVPVYYWRLHLVELDQSTGYILHAGQSA